MGQLGTWVGTALAAAVLALVLKKDSPPLAFLVGLAGVLCLLWGMLEPVGQLIGSIRVVLGKLDSTETLYIPVMKAVGIALVVRVAGAICQDAGQAALAAQLEIVGTAAAILVCLPLLSQVFAVVSRMIV